MSTKTKTYSSLADVIAFTHNNLLMGAVNLASKQNDIINQIPWQQAADITSHPVRRMTTYATATVVDIDEGVDPTKGVWTSISEPIKLITSLSEIPTRIVEINASPNAYRADQDLANSLGVWDEFLDQLFYGDSDTSPKELDGLSVRMPTLATHSATTGPYIINNGGSSNVTSIYAVGWGTARKTYCVYPLNHASYGLKAEDLGKYMGTDAASKKLQVYGTQWDLNVGLVNESPRTIGRLCNIETAITGTIIDDDKLMELLSYMGNDVALYANRVVLYHMSKLAKDKSNVNWTPDEAFGRPIVRFMGVPIYRCDSIKGALGTYEDVVS